MADWFAPRRYGCGCGLPISWQGWAASLFYIAIVVAAAFFFDRSPWAAGSAIFTATALFLIVSARTTRGGWHWQWGSSD